MNKIETFDIYNLEKNAYHVGNLTEQIINILGINRPEDIILFGKDKILYTLKHKHEFENEDSYKKHIELVPMIIDKPDYVGIHPKGKSIEYIKQIDEIMVVPVRLKSRGVLWVKTAFPITAVKLQIYLNWGTMKKV